MGISLSEPKRTTFFARCIFCERLPIACTKTFTVELMNVYGLWDSNEKKVEKLLYLLVFGVSLVPRPSLPAFNVANKT